jgi:hypothetical protein
MEGQVWGMNQSEQAYDAFHQPKEVNKNQILTKFFPSLRYGRDTDLDRYISLREGGKPLKEWKSYYDNLARRYTETERKKLIQAFRKQLHHFQIIFKQILERLYERVDNFLKRQIDTLIDMFKDSLGKDVLTLQQNTDFFKLIGQALTLFSPDRYEALGHLDFLIDFAQKTGYKIEPLNQIASFIRGYLDGSLFMAVKAKEVYHFDINEEKGKSPSHSKAERSAPIRMHLFLSDEDISKIILCEDEEDLNEYELCFAYLTKYMELLNDEDFAAKIFVFSRKHKTNHYMIFDRIRQGISFNHQKERIFDDIFKIICAGRYVYNIKLEKLMSLKLRLLTSTLTKQEVKKKKNDGLAAKIHTKSEVSSIKKASEEQVSPAAARRRNKKRKLNPAGSTRKVRQKLKARKSSRFKKVQAGERKPAKQPRLQQTRLPSKPETKQVEKKSMEHLNQFRAFKARPSHKPFATRSTLSIKEMIGELSPDKHVQRTLLEEFKKRLPRFLQDTQQVGQSVSSELIHFVCHNYDAILIEHEKADFYIEKLDELGFSLHAVYTAILHCFNELKTDFFTHQEKFRGFSGLFFFHRPGV